MEKYKKHIRISNRLLDALCDLKYQRLRQIQAKLEDFGFKYSDITKDSHVYKTAVDRHLYSAANKVQIRIGRNLYDLTHQLQLLRDFINTDEQKPPRLGSIFDGLMQLDHEFGGINIDLKARTLSVTTETIVLEEIAFGSFEIKLFIDKISKLSNESPYRVIALEPNPAGSDSEVTHPHVSHEQLCEGDGYILIRKALKQGRICDFFTIIEKILQTYNPDSPYVSLDDWCGVGCYDCGYTVAGDECYYCENCERDYCSQCSTYCQICDSTICLGCAYECPDCKKPVCRNCTAVCTECDEMLCTDCINEEGLCQSCEEKRKDQDNEEQKENTTEPKAVPAVQSDSMGETIVHA